MQCPFFSGEMKRNRGQMWWTNHSARDWSLDYTLCMCVGCSCVGAASDSSLTCMHECVLYCVCCTACCVVRVDATTLNVVMGFVRDIPEAFSFPFPGAHRGGHCCEFEKKGIFVLLAIQSFLYISIHSLCIVFWRDEQTTRKVILPMSQYRFQIGMTPERFAYIRGS